MKVAIIGGGFTGLAAAYELGKRGHEVTIFEKEKTLGGLAYGFKEPNWDWYLEGGYHHWFTNDTAMFQLIHELGLSDKLILKRPITAQYLPPDSKLSFESRKAVNIVQLDSPVHLFRFPLLSPIDKLRTAALLAFCKLNPFWQPLEGITAKDLFISVGGKHAWDIIWKPLMIGKFGSYADNVAASWLWARVKKRTPRLAYIEGGFHTVIRALEDAITHYGGKVFTGTPVHAINKGSRSTYHVSWKGNSEPFDRVFLTVPTPIACKLCPSILRTDTQPLLTIPHLHAQTLILETRQPVLDAVYWLNIADCSFPFLAVVAHTNFVDKKHYGNHHITYFGNYLPAGHPFLALSAKELLKVFQPFIQRLNPHFNSKFPISKVTLFRGWYAQPVHELHYSRRAPKLEPSINGVYLANLDSIYPWDRGTNYAVALGIKAAKRIPET